MASKKKGPVEKIALQCTECKQKNYTTEKNRRNTPGKLELNKYCPFDRKHHASPRDKSKISLPPEREVDRSVAPMARASVSKTEC